MDEISSQVVDARLTKVPLRDWTHDLEAMAKVDADIAYVVNPHNPTGTALPLDALERFATEGKARLVVVDEAYIDFTDDPSATTAIPLARAGRAAVLRTFSKIHGLAGLRVGYLVAERAIVATLRKIRAPFSVGVLGQAAALAALKDPGHRQAVRQHTLKQRDLLTKLVTRAGYQVIPSHANFVLVQAPDEEQLIAKLATYGVSVRPGSALGVPGTVRMSVPTAKGLELLERALA
jgi:histidinol-phosphate aminotransferase